MDDGLESQNRMTPYSAARLHAEKFGGMYDGEHAWNEGGWLREELRKRTTVLAVVGKVLYVHATIAPAFLDHQMVPTAKKLNIAAPVDRPSFFPGEGHHTSLDGTTRYSLTDNYRGEITPNARAIPSEILKHDDAGMTPEDREKLFHAINIETWKEMDSRYGSGSFPSGIIFSSHAEGTKFFSPRWGPRIVYTDY